MSILSGFLFGLSTLLFIGPVFFYLLKSSIESGLKAGIAVATGIIVGDIICVLLAIYGFGDYFETPIVQKFFAGIGGILLLAFGLNYFFKPSINLKVEGKFTSKKIMVYFINGFLINFINPFVFAVWFGFYTVNKAKLENENSIIISMTVTLIVIFSTDLLKAFFAKKITNYIKPSKLKIIFKAFGVIMIGFAIRLFFVLFK